MLKELLETVGKMAVEASLPKIVAFPQEPRHVYALAMANGQLVEREANASIREHTVLSLHSFASVVKALDQDVDQATHLNNKSTCREVWYSRKGVVATLNRMRRDKVTLPLEYSPQLIELLAREKPKTMKQAEFVFLLRTTLAGCVRDNLLEILRRVNFTSGVQGQSELGHGRSSIGKAVQAELTGLGGLPEEVTFDVPMFAALFLFRAPVTCAVEIYPETQTFALVTLPGCIERAIAAAEESLGKALEAAFADETVLFYGFP